MKRGGKVVTAATAVVTAGAAVAAAVGFGGGSAGTSAASTLPPATAQVTRQTLVDSETASGELGYGTTTTVTNRLSGTITGLAATGATVTRGGTLYRVDDQPVMVLYGSLPAYRTLAPGVEGADVTQFERNLRALGYGGFTVNDEYTSDTADAVRQWQEDRGLPETGTVEPGRIIYAAGPVRIDSREAAVGDAAQPGQDVLVLTGTTRLVTVKLDVDDQRLARRDSTVRVTLPDGDTAAGKITNTETVIETSEGAQSEPETKIEVTIALTGRKSLAGYAEASVDVAFTASERKDVLTVPVAALLALAEGGYGVEVIEGGTSRIVAVDTGLFAGGWVEVSGGGIAEGTIVGVPT
ncbi:MAG TPA: peptidoglycan-binding domain-containing protein [Pilimelia sp.]|nr:peptidoglycan-binding domain-containing protein [Pilimelia sp.]